MFILFFEGPGFAIRIIGEVTPEYITFAQEADHIFLLALKQHALYDKVSQAYAGFLPIKTVGVVGDTRRYGYIIGLRAVTTIDFMTARPFEFPPGFLEKVASEIISTISSVARVFYDVTSKPPGII